LICRGGAAEQLAVHVEVLDPVLNVFRPILNMMGCFVGFCWGYGDVTKRRGYNNDSLNMLRIQIIMSSSCRAIKHPTSDGFTTHKNGIFLGMVDPLALLLYTGY